MTFNCRGHPAQVARVSRVINQIVRERKAVARSDGTTHQIFPVAIDPAEGESLREWVIREGAKRTIEIGFGYAISTLFICEGLLHNGGERHVGIDPFQTSRFADCGLQFLEDAGVEALIEFHADESQIVLPQFLAEGRTFDFAFVDGNHRFDGVFLDLIYLGRLLRPRSVVFVDDYQLPSVVKAAAFCMTNLDWSLEETSWAHDDHQWAVLRTATTPPQRGFDHFVDF